MLRSETDYVHARAMLNLITPAVINNLDVKACTDKLFERNVIRESDKEEIETREKLMGPIAAVRLLLDKVPRTSPRWDIEFAAVLKTHGLNDIAAILCLSPGNHAQEEGVPKQSK